METPIDETPTTNETIEDTSTIDHTPAEAVSLRHLLARAGRVYDITIAVALDEAEMDDLPMRGVSVLRRIDEGDAGTPLADVLRGGRISRQHGTQLIDTLVERGYIVRETDPEDRRRMRVSLTERGRAAADAARTAMAGLNASLAEKVSPEQLEASRAVLSALVELAPEGVRPGANWGPDRGGRPGDGEHRHGPHGRGRGQGRRGPMRDFDPRGAWRGDRGDQMQAFAAPDDDEQRPERGEGPARHDRGEDEHRGDGRPCGPRGRHGHEGRRDDRDRRAGGSPTIIQHADTVIVNSGPAPDGRGSHRNRHGGRSFGPWQRQWLRDDARPESPQADVPSNE